MARIFVLLNTFLFPVEGIMIIIILMIIMTMLNIVMITMMILNIILITMMILNMIMTMNIIIMMMLLSTHLLAVIRVSLDNGGILKQLSKLFIGQKCPFPAISKRA